eukprot:NODE_1349_length_952_cov_158.726467_g1040_i0.p1 GENE.NODE_1349_length_952_cov_158.726467_g1040_i0~~NODE_1349_length_952_cov_158.726467_g1040_i0.p1  ORF type:complete len:250 (-),score=74.55 NODE_1349_length_952_cov_158.726467_g1040_i0:14-763(-)
MAGPEGEAVVEESDAGNDGPVTMPAATPAPAPAVAPAASTTELSEDALLLLRNCLPNENEFSAEDVAFLQLAEVAVQDSRGLAQQQWCSDGELLRRRLYHLHALHTVQEQLRHDSLRLTDALQDAQMQEFYSQQQQQQQQHNGEEKEEEDRIGSCTTTATTTTRSLAETGLRSRPSARNANAHAQCGRHSLSGPTRLSAAAAAGTVPSPSPPLRRIFVWALTLVPVFLLFVRHRNLFHLLSASLGLPLL